MRRREWTKMLLIGCGLAVLLAGCAAKGLEQAVKEGGSKLSADQLAELLEGNTIHMDQYGELADIELLANGSFRAVNHRGQEDKGRWIAKEEQLCLHFGKWSHGDIRCYTVYRVGEEYRQFAGNGTLMGTFTVSEGTSRPAAEPATRRKKSKKAPGAATAAMAAGPAAPEQTETAAPAPATIPTAALDTHAREDLRFITRQMAKYCPGCDLARIELPSADLIRANLAGADFTGAGLGKANLRRANLRGASLVAADLAGADLGGADLQGADLSRANLTGANLYQANIKGANLGGAVGADLNGALR
jgi:hypothetical protein